MADRRDEERALSRDELELADRARQPELGTLGEGELADLVRRLRDRRDRARQTAHRQRREMRGKAPPAGVVAATDNSGTAAKARCLDAALRRAQGEVTKRRDGGEASQADLARKALAMKEAAENGPQIPEDRTANEGMRSIPNEGIAPSGALEAEGYKPVLERSRKVR